MQPNATIQKKKAVENFPRLDTRLAFARSVAVLFLHQNGYTVTDIAQVFRVKRQFIEKILKEYGK
jgi:hypothetical protein